MRKEKLIIITVAREGTKAKDVLEALVCAESVKQSFLDREVLVKIVYIEKSDFSESGRLKRKIKKLKPGCVFNLFEGFMSDPGKEVDFVEIIEDMEILFTGNFSQTLKNCLNKQAAKDILIKNRISVPQGLLVNNINDLEGNNLSLPIFIKPCFEDASVGIDENSLVVSRDDLYKIIGQKLENFHRGLLVEEFIPGREFSVGFLGEFPYELLGISTMDYSRHQDLVPFLIYAAKWEASSRSSRVLIPCCKEKIEGNIKGEIIDIASQAGRALGCRGYFRVDLREKNGDLFVIDVNPNPDINKDSGFMRQAYHKGYSYDDAVEKILNSAV
ncbi:MAG: ATP-grasp domain-containing protein [Candidatus Omnitrophica bacterium]|nr:ATP-grasp domain-containing protein [Candidatus Omnitrophota bacterium]